MASPGPRCGPAHLAPVPTPVVGPSGPSGPSFAHSQTLGTPSVWPALDKDDEKDGVGGGQQLKPRRLTK